MRHPLKEGTRHLRSSSLPSGMRLNSLRIKECSSSKSASYRIGSTRNDMVLQGLKPRIFDKLNKHGKKWAAELPSVLWSLRTTPSRAIGFTPFFLVYGSEAMLLTDVEYGSPRLKAYNKKSNDATREDALD
jgi:hypothetical protein